MIENEFMKLQQAELKNLIEKHASKEGGSSTAVPCLRFFCATAPSEFLHTLYEPSLCIIAQGSKAVGLGERLQHKPAKLSGGEQQRVALARAFIGQPALLLADEPTGNLDQHTGQKIADLLFRMNKESGSSLVIVTHDVALATRCQRQVHMQAGQLEESR